MTPGQAIDLGKDFLLICMSLAGPILIAGMIVGLAISVFQSVTQIQEQSMSFVFKIAASASALVFLAPWMLRKIIDFASLYLGHLDKFIR